MIGIKENVLYQKHVASPDVLLELMTIVQFEMCQ